MGNLKTIGRYGLLLLSILIYTSQTFADAVIVMSRGDNDILSLAREPSKEKSSQVFFEGKHYNLTKAKIGRTVKSGDVIKTANSGLMRIVFPSGDSMNVGPASALFIENQTPTKATSKTGVAPTLNLIYGKVRAVISKTGPMNNLNVKTQSAVAGVRGTDFFVSFIPALNETKALVFRGSVEVQPLNQKTEQPILINPGFSYIVTKELKVSTPQTTTKEELSEIQKISDLNLSKQEFSLLKEDEKVLVKKSEQQSQKIILADIEATDPKLAQIIKDKKITSSRAMNALTINTIYKSAPSDPNRSSKPSESDLKKIMDENVYDEHFE